MLLGFFLFPRRSKTEVSQRKVSAHTNCQVHAGVNECGPKAAGRLVELCLLSWVSLSVLGLCPF